MPVLFVCLDTFVQCFLYSASRVRASDHFQIMQDCKTFMTGFRVGNVTNIQFEKRTTAFQQERQYFTRLQKHFYISGLLDVPAG